jgi:hypothetical protein
VFEEVYAIAVDYNMDLLIQKLKLGIVKQGTVQPLHDMEANGTRPDVVLDAFAEFAVDELRNLPG